MDFNNHVPECPHWVLNRANPFLPFPGKIKEEEMTFVVMLEYEMDMLLKGKELVVNIGGCNG